MTLRYRIFIYVAAFFLLANLLVMNDFSSLWPGAESWLAWRSLEGKAGATPYEWMIGLVISDGPVRHFWLRLPGVVVFLAALVGYWAVARRLFSQDVLLKTLLVLGSSLFIPNIAKAATGDIWAMATQWLAFILMVRFLKQPALVWRLLFYGVLLPAVWIQPANALIFLMGSSAFLYILHPNGKHLWRLNPWLAGLLVAGGLYFLGLLSFGQNGFLAGFRTGRFLLWNLIGLFPFLGFVLAGCWETIRRVGRREEMALLSAAGLIFALLGHSLALQGILALLVARQLRNYFDPNYPHKAIVKAGAIIHLIIAFFIIMPLTVAGFIQFQAAGFRAMLAAGGIYWMFSFIAVIGLFGSNERYLHEGLLLGGLLATTLFWLQVNPLLQQKFSWPKTLVEQSEQYLPSEGIGHSYLEYRQGEPFPPLAPYSRAAYPETELLSGPDSLQAAWDSAENAVFFLDRVNAEKLEAATPVDSVQGWNSRLKAVDYVLLMKK